MTTPEHHSVVVVGAGQAGLSLSYFLKQRGIDHLVLEKRSPVHTWRTQRWDSFCLVTPNWQCKLPGWDYRGDDPHGFMKRDEIIAYLEGFVKHVDAPLHSGVTVQRVSRRSGFGSVGGFDIATSQGHYTADQIVVASGGYHQPIIPRLAERLPASVLQIHSEQYRNPGALPPGKVLVVGNGQSGSQLAEDLHLAGREVVLATGDAPRCARFYRGKDVVDWLADMGYYDMSVHEHPLREGVRDNTNHFVTGRDGGRDIDLRQFAREGMELYGQLIGLEDDTLIFNPDLRHNLDHADRIYNGINASIDKYIEKAGIIAPRTLGLHAGVGAGGRTHAPEAARLGHRLGDLVHRLPARFRLARRSGVQRAWPARPCARRHRPGRRLLSRASLAAHLGIRPIFRRGTRCTVHRGADRGAWRESASNGQPRSSRADAVLSQRL